MVQQTKWIEALSEVYNQPMDFEFRGSGNAWVGFQSPHYFPLKKPVTTCGCGFQEFHNNVKRLLKHSSLFHLHVCVRPAFLHMFQPKPCLSSNTRNIGADVTPQVSSIKAQSFKRFANTQNNAILPLPFAPHFFFFWFVCLGKSIYFSIKVCYLCKNVMGLLLLLSLSLVNKYLKCQSLISNTENMDIYNPHKHKLFGVPK